MSVIREIILWQRKTFGPGANSARAVDHLYKELTEVVESGGSPDEWVDVLFLALDGLSRSLDSDNGTEAFFKVQDKLSEKLDINYARKWPDWRTADPNKAIEHIKEPVRYTEN